MSVNSASQLSGRVELSSAIRAEHCAWPTVKASLWLLSNWYPPWSVPAYLRTSECTVCSLGQSQDAGSIDGWGGRGPTYSVFNELPLGGGSDYQGAAFLVNLTLEKKRKTGVQQEGKDKGRRQEELPSESRWGTVSHIWKMWACPSSLLSLGLTLRRAMWDSLQNRYQEYIFLLWHMGLCLPVSLKHICGLLGPYEMSTNRK